MSPDEIAALITDDIKIENGTKSAAIAGPKYVKKQIYTDFSKLMEEAIIRDQKRQENIWEKPRPIEPYHSPYINNYPPQINNYPWHNPQPFVHPYLEPNDMTIKELLKQLEQGRSGLPLKPTQPKPIVAPVPPKPVNESIEKPKRKRHIDLD